MVILEDCEFTGNVSPNIGTFAYLGTLILKDVTANQEAAFTAAYGLTIGAYTDRVMLINSSLGVTSAFGTNDIYYSVTAGHTEIHLVNTILSCGTEIGGITTMGYRSVIRFHKKDQSSTTFSVTYRRGTIAPDSITRHTASGYSWKLTPNTTYCKLYFPGPSKLDTFKVAVNASSLVTINAWVYKDASYTGNQPKLAILGGLIGGIADDVEDLMTVGLSTWEQLTVTGTPNEQGVVEFIISCDGTAGNVYVDDITVSQA
jgi:hypothetical protein